MKKALITGITGQDGSYLTELLLSKGYEVHGIIRRASTFNTSRLENIFQDPHEQNLRLILHYGDLSDGTSLIKIINKSQPDEIYNLAAQSHVRVSFEKPEYTSNIDALGALRILEAIRILKLEDKVKFYQASSSEMFGVSSPPQGINTPFHPCSPYGIAKLYAHWISVNYRQAYNMFVSCGILFNHESPRRGETFVSRKITRAATRISLGLQDRLYLGNLNAMRDWGHAKDFVEAMYLITQQNTPKDYVIATGEQHSVREFCEKAFKQVGIDIIWTGGGRDEVGVDKSTKREIIKIDDRYIRPVEVESLLGDITEAKQQLNWKPKITFQELIKNMIEEDLKLAETELHLKECKSVIKDSYH